MHETICNERSQKATVMSLEENFMGVWYPLVWITMSISTRGSKLSNGRAMVWELSASGNEFKLLAGEDVVS